ncbi:MAG TPA: ArsR family transcriptional regulator [Ignavibacteria bacterium]|nr:ArsR family transcriptional regulator [Ignavibacteria bacterium]
MIKEKESPVCGITYIDEKKVKKVEKKLPSRDTLYNTADILKTLGDPTRLKIVIALAEEELCVCDLTALTDVSVSGVSHQLRILRGQRIVKYRRQGKMVYYSLDDKHVEDIVAKALQHVKESYTRKPH